LKTAVAHPVSSADPTVGNITKYTYDVAGNLKTLQDADNNTTTWDYDNLDRVKVETNSLNKKRHYSYDANGNLTQYIDRNSRTTNYTYDHLNRLTAERWHSLYGSGDVNTIPYTYDDDGRLLSTTDDTFSYDHLGRLTSTTQSLYYNYTLGQTFYDNSSRK